MKNTKDTEITPILECIDPSISSCSEMVTHLLQYTEEDVRMHNLIADTLLSGIMLDTGFFKNRVDTSTYAACNFLVQKGARSENASNMLKEAYETEYWLRLLYRTEFITEKEFESIEKDVLELISILISICKTASTR